MHHKKAADVPFIHISQVTHMPGPELSVFLLSGRLARMYWGEQLMNAKQDNDLKGFKKVSSIPESVSLATCVVV